MDKLLYNQYFRFICFYAYQLSGDKNLAEDVAQEAFTSYYQQKAQVSNNPSAIKSFLYSSVRNYILNLHKRSQIKQRYWEKTVYKEEDSIDLEESILYTELLAEVETLISKLPKVCQQVMRLSYFEGLSNAEIIEKLDISINTLKTHRKRGLKYIQNHINPEFYLILCSLLFH
ncbi:RNA polymerase sigma factor [Sphingobacterium lactis]|uniref:RNA polymerase sigma factor n=1 Tax=Sphingobacterium lactis TaxID=797291 RepID=UPI003F7E7B1B